MRADGNGILQADCEGPWEYQYEHGLCTVGKEQPLKVSKEGVPLDRLKGYCDNTGIVI